MPERDHVIHTSSLEYVKVPVDAELDGSPHDPTADIVQFAFVGIADAGPDAGDWVVGSWETDGSAGGVVYKARCLVGPAGAVALAAGRYQIFVKVTDNPEAPVKKAPNLLRVV